MVMILWVLTTMVKHIWIITGWWFGTFFIFPYIENNHPNWGVETTSQIITPQLLSGTYDATVYEKRQDLLDPVTWREKGNGSEEFPMKYVYIYIYIMCLMYVHVCMYICGVYMFINIYVWWIDMVFTYIYIYMYTCIHT